MDNNLLFELRSKKGCSQKTPRSGVERACFKLLRLLLFILLQNYSPNM